MNTIRTPGLSTYQAVLNLKDATAATGATVLVPGSHHRFEEVFKDAHRSSKDVRQSSVDYVTLGHAGDYEKYCSGAVQAVLRPGDLLVWDSRVIHCAQGCDWAAEDAMPGATEPLARLVAYICMIPRAHLRQHAGSAKARREYVLSGRTSGHNPAVPARVDEERSADSVYTPPPPDHPCWCLV